MLVHVKKLLLKEIEKGKTELHASVRLYFPSGLLIMHYVVNIRESAAETSDPSKTYPNCPSKFTARRTFWLINPLL